MTKASGEAKVPTPARRSLVDYVRAKRREGCKVCGLGGALLQQMREARSKKIPRAVIVEWLAEDFGLQLTAGDLDAHNNGRHDDA